MARVLLVLLAVLALGLTAGPGFGQEHPPRVNPLTGKPYGPKALAEYEAAIKQQQAEEEAARAASEEAEQRWQEARARNAEQIRAFDEAIEDWQEEHPAPAGTRESLVATSYDNDTALGEHAEITYYNDRDVPTHKVQFGPDGQPTGPVAQTQQGKAWETIGPRIPPDGGIEVSYGKDFEGNEIITEAHIFDAGGRSLQSYEFNFDGVPWRGETRDPETGLRNGGFQDDRFKPPPRTLGGPLAVPPTVRLITGVCTACRPLADEHNDLANEINTIIAEMATLSREHQHAYPPAQKPIRMRYDALEKRLAELMARFEALRARVLECERQCSPQAQTPAGDGPALARPAFQPVPDLAPPASFCSEFERVAFLNDVYNPAVAAALANAGAAQDHQARLNALFTEHMRANSPWWGQVRAERDAFEPVAAETIVRAEALRGMYPAILAVPIAPCPEQPRIATGGEPGAEPAAVVAGTPPMAVRTGGTTPEDCPPKPGRQPITVGANSKVGSGARLRAKVGGMAMGALAGALGGGGGGGGSDGPDLWTCKIKESEYTVFDDPATGVSLRVGAKRAKGGKVVIFSEIARSPDKGTFQTAFLENPLTGETQAPGDVGPCDLWGEWKLTVSWTKTTYVDGQMVSQEHGGWQKTGLFSIPGVLSKVDAPDGLWKRMGFSNASNGAREIGMIYDVPPGGGPLTFVIHVTRPKGDPVMTVPFVLTMAEGPNGFVFTKAEDPPCPPETIAIADGPRTGEAPLPPPEPALPPPPPPQGLPPWQVNHLPMVQVASSDNLQSMRGMIDEADKAPCPDGYRKVLDRIRWSRDEFRRMVPSGHGADSMRDVIDETVRRLDQMEDEVLAKMAASSCPSASSVLKTDGPAPQPAPYTPPPGGSTGPRLPFTPPPDQPVSEPAKVDRFVSEARTADSGLARALEAAAKACPADPGRSWTALRNRARAVLVARLMFLSSMRPMGPGTEHMTDAVGREFNRTMLLLQEVNALQPPPCPGQAPDQQPTEEETESILDDIEEKLVIG